MDIYKYKISGSFECSLALTRDCNRDRAATAATWPPHLGETPEYPLGTLLLPERYDPSNQVPNNNQ